MYANCQEPSRDQAHLKLHGGMRVLFKGSGKPGQDGATGIPAFLPLVLDHMDHVELVKLTQGLTTILIPLLLQGGQQFFVYIRSRKKQLAEQSCWGKADCFKIPRSFLIPTP